MARYWMVRLGYAGRVHLARGGVTLCGRFLADHRIQLPVPSASGVSPVEEFDTRTDACFYCWSFYQNLPGAGVEGSGVSSPLAGEGTPAPGLVTNTISQQGLETNAR